MPSPSESTLHNWLALTVCTEREAKGFTKSEVAGLLGVAEASVHRFELGQTWPHRVDQYLAAYAELLDVADARTFYAKALKRWHAEGQRPILERTTAAERAAIAAKRAAQRTKQARSG